MATLCLCNYDGLIIIVYMYILQHEICYQSLEEKKTIQNNINDSLYWFWVRNFVPVSEKTVAKLF